MKTPKKKVLNTPSTRKQANGERSESTLPLKTASTSNKLLASIHNTKLIDFIDALVDGDRSKLSDEDFQRVYEQYSDELITEKDRYRLRLILEIKNFEYKTTYVKAALTYLQHGSDDEEVKNLIAKGLMTIGATEVKLPAIADTAKLEAWFKRLTGRLKKWAGLVQAKQEELDGLKPKDTGADLTRNNFDEMIIELSSMLKFQVNEHETTVSKYIVMIKRYRKLVEKSKK